MNILVIGSGGREHALCWKIKESPKVDKVFAAPGSAGMAADGINIVDMDQSDHAGLVQFAKENDVELTIVGPEAPLVAGIVDDFQKAGLTVFGPTAKAARIEGSKQYAKELMEKYNIPTGKFASFTKIEEAKAYVEGQGAPIVIKADGLAAGKGVIVAMTLEEALDALDQIMGDRAFGDAGNVVVVEEFLDGEELSLMAFVHGETVIPMVPVQDHKRAYDNDEGPNTGGMGAYSPVPHIDDRWIKQAEEEVLHPMAKGMVTEGVTFTGILYAGLMMTAEGPKVIEFNARFGDPETQVVLPRLETDLVDVLTAVMANDDLELSWKNEACAGVVLASEGYPGEYVKGSPMTISEDLPQGQKWYHAGTVLEDGVWKTNGGRVLLLSTLAETLPLALEKSYVMLNKSKWPGVFYRHDIGSRAINLSSK